MPPTWHSTIDPVHPLLQLGFDSYAVESAPGWDCAMERDAFLQEKVNTHFGLSGAMLHLRLIHYTRECLAGQFSLSSTCTDGASRSRTTGASTRVFIPYTS